MPRYLHAILIAFLLMLTASTASAYAPQGLSMSEQKVNESGSPLAATDAAGNIVWKENYRPFGERLTNQAEFTDNRQWFHGKAADTGLQYFGARYYDLKLKAFVDNCYYFNICLGNKYAG